MQPMVRTKATHDPSSMEGQAYLPKVLFYEVSTTGSGAVTVFTAAPGTYIHEVVGRISEAFDTNTTVDVGDEDTAAKFIANNEWTESTLNQLASSKQTTAPDGAYYTAHKQIKVTVGGVGVTTGKVELMFFVYNLVEMGTQAYHAQKTVP